MVINKQALNINTKKCVNSLALKALRLDPALGSGVVVTAVTDVFGFFSFLAIGSLLVERLS
jgi:Mg/Co/Ni transporter MgtE